MATDDDILQELKQLNRRQQRTNTMLKRLVDALETNGPQQ